MCPTACPGRASSMALERMTTVESLITAGTFTNGYETTGGDSWAPSSYSTESDDKYVHRWPSV